MIKGKDLIIAWSVVLLVLSNSMTGLALPENEEQKTVVQSVLVICPFPDVAKRQIVENAFVNALSKISVSKAIYPYIGSLSKGEKISKDEFVKWVNEKKVEALLFINIKGIASNLDDMGGAPDPYTMSSEADEPDGGVQVPRGRAAKTWYQAQLVDFKSGKSLWKEVTMVLGDVWLSLKSVSKSMAKKTAKQLKKTGLLVTR